MSTIELLVLLNFALVLGSIGYLVWTIRRRQRQAQFHVKLITILTSATALRDLLERVATEIQIATHAKQAFFFVYRPDDRFVSSGTRGYLRPTVGDCRELEVYFRKTGNSYARPFMLHGEAELRRMLKSYRVDFVMPFHRGGEIIGFIFLGPRSSGTYTPYDIGMISDIRNELAIAIQNAASLEVVKELNAHLQQRIDVATDELRKTNEKLRGLDIAKDEFVGMASHQLRTPLTSIKGYLSMVLEGDAGKITKMQRQLLREAFTSSERMVHLINDFLSVSRVQTGKFLIEKRSFDLVKSIRQEVRALEAIAESRDLTLEFTATKPSVVVSADEAKIRQVVINFIDNAMHYSKQGTVITIALAVTETQVAVTVTDTGIGVPLKQQSKLFTKFFRADNARTQRPDGTGVGLYLAKKVIDGHKGKIIFTSQEGKGSVFGFSLPLASNDTDNTDNK